MTTVVPGLGPIGYEDGVCKLPDSVTQGFRALQQEVPTLTGEELQRKYNPPDDEDAPTQCLSPLALLGRTKDGLIAYVGANYLGTISEEELRQAIAQDPHDRVNRQLSKDLERILS